MYIVKARITKIPETQTTRLQPVYRQLPASGDAELLIDPSYFLQQKMKIEGVKIYLLRIRLSSLTKICTHLDGSLEGHGRLSWVFLQRRGRTFRKGHGIILVVKYSIPKLLELPLNHILVLAEGQSEQKNIYTSG